MKPFRIEIPDARLDDLRQRVAATRWPAAYSGPGWERGVPLGYLRELADYWHTQYDWRAAERLLNSHPQFTTEIDGVNVHFLHVTSPEPGARPLLLTHSWPGSIVEFLDMVSPLTDPRAHGHDPADAFHVVIPSLPGHGFSGPIEEPGWDVRRIAGALAELMHRLGYDSYFTGGGDWGSIISLELARLDPDHIAGVHLSWPTVPSRDAVELSTMSEADLAAMDQVSMTWFDSERSAYLRMQTTRPLTVAFGLSDSPAGQLAWIVEKFFEWNKLVKTPEDEVDRDRLLTNVSIYWLTGTMGSSLQLYYESGQQLGALFAPGVPTEPIRVPVGIAVFKQDPAPPFRIFADVELSTIKHWSVFDNGGHFGPMEHPEVFVGDLRAFCRGH
jgi:microsomal epoxide hydrolase